MSAVTSPQPQAHPRLDHGDTFTYRGYEFRVSFEHDAFMGEPWKEHDGHGPVSAWTARDKRPGERILAVDRHHRRYYDVKAALKIARRDGWGCSCPEGTHQTARQRAACAVDRDFEYLRGWCADEWQWTSVDVQQLEAGQPVGERESLGGIDGDHDGGKYLTEVAYELADQIIARIEVENPDIIESVN